LYNKSNFTELVFIKSDINNKYYLVQNIKNKEQAANLLALIDENIIKFKNHLNSLQENKKYIELLNKRLKNTQIYENNDNFKSTSYTYNKGKYLVFCLRSKKNNKLHDINTIMYVVIHELSHIACPEIGHTDLFKEIFEFFTKEAININIYQYENYKINGKEYCGLFISDSIIN